MSAARAQRTAPRATRPPEPPASRRTPLRRLPAALGVLAALALALAAVLFLPLAAGTEARVPLDAVLVDASASATAARAWLPWARAELARAARAAAERGAEVVVLVYGEGVATAFPPGPPARLLARLEGRAGAPLDPAAGPGRAATELAAALEVLEPLVADARRRPGVATLLAAPSYTGASPAGALARLARAGVELDVRLPPEPAECDLALLELALPPRVEVGSELVALARLSVAPGAHGAPGCADAEIVLEIEGERGPRTLVRSFPLPGAGGELEVPLACGPAGAGRTLVRARVRSPGGPDPVPENDAAVATTRAEGARVIGVAVRDELRGAARAWLVPSGRSALAGLEPVFLAPEEVAGALAGLDALVSFDLPPRALPGPLVEDFVRRGGGWLALSGWGLLADWTPGDPGTPLARLLPCEPAAADVPPRDVVLLVDGSGSMEGEPFEAVRAAAAELVAAALPGDRVSMRFFTVALEREHVLKQRSATRAEDQDAARRAARELLELFVPRGMTFLLASLAELARSTGEHETLALLLTDGWERDALSDELGTAERVAAELRRAGVRLVVVAVGRANLELLGVLAGGLERVQRADTLDDLRAIFHRELFRAQVVEGELAVELAPRVPGSLADAVASAAARAVELAPLERYVRNRLRPGAEALWTSGEGDPLLALARAGAGRTALFASRPTAGWAPRWVRAGSGEPAEFEGLLRWLARGPERDRAPRARLAGDVLTVTGLAPGTPAELDARLVELDGAQEERALRLAAEGGAGRDARTTRTARLADSPAAPAALVLSEAAGGHALALERELPDEYAHRERRVPPEWLAPGARASAAAARDPHGGASHPAAPWVLALGLGLLLAAGLARARGQGVPGFGR